MKFGQCACFGVAVLLFLPSCSALPVKEWSAKYRGWHYFPSFVLPPTPVGPGLIGIQLTDCGTVYEVAEEPGTYFMSYLTYDGVGYQTAIASSADLIKWNTSSVGISYSPRADKPPLAWNATPGDFDYGGAAFIGPLLQNYSMEAARVLKKADGNYWFTYYGQPRRGGYELDPGGSGMAKSVDGINWHRGTSVPFLSTTDPDAKVWENKCEYAPFLLEHEQTYHVIYNAKGTNALGLLSEESGVATMPSTQTLPGTTVNGTRWTREVSNPVLPNGNKSGGAWDTYQAADPKVWWDGDHWTMFYFGNGGGTGAAIMAAFSTDLIHWEKDPEPLYKPGGHPQGLDKQHAHKVWVVYKDGVGHMFYTAVGPDGRGIALLTSENIQDTSTYV